MRRIVTTTLVLTGVAVAAACGGGDDGSSLATETVPEDPDVVVRAEDMVFDPDELEVPAGEELTFVIDNRDDGVNHNIHIEGAPEPNKTRLEQGVSQQALTVTLEAGDYEFVCDIHPNMTGTLIAGE